MNLLNRVLLFSCFEATEAVEKENVVGLNFIEKARLNKHLQLCNACRMYAGFSKKADLAIQKITEAPSNQNDSDTTELEKKILNKVFSK